MPRGIGPKTEQEFRKLRRNAQAKIRRVQKKYGVDLSDSVNIPSINDFSSRKEFNEWARTVESFTNRNNLNFQFRKNQFDVVATKAELNRIELNTRRAQRLADEEMKRIENLPFKQKGKQFGTVGERQRQRAKPDTGISRPLDFDFNEIKSRSQFVTKMKNREEQAKPDYFDERMERMKENFITMLERAFNSDANELIKEIRKMPSDDFYDMYLQNEHFSFNLYYPMEGVEDSHYYDGLNRMAQTVEDYFEGNFNNDFKGF